MLDRVLVQNNPINFNDPNGLLARDISNAWTQGVTYYNAGISQASSALSSGYQSLSQTVQNGFTGAATYAKNYDASGSLFGDSQAGFLNFNAKVTNDLNAGTLKSSVEGSVLHAGWNGENGNLSGTADAYKWRAELEGGVTNISNFSSTAKIAAFEGAASGAIAVGKYNFKGTTGATLGSIGYQLKIGLNGVTVGAHFLVGASAGFEWESH